MSALTHLDQKETDNLIKLQRLENEALSFTVKSLSRELEAAFKAHSTPDDIDITQVTHPYTNIYAASMMVSWLLGQAHVQNAITEAEDKPVELTYAPIYLAVDDVPFQEAMDALKVMLPTDTKEYRQMEAAMKLRAFTVANVSSIDAVNRVKKRYEDALESGAYRSETLGNIRQLLEQEGLSEANPYWLELHYRNNMMTAYNSGRWTQIANNDLVEFLVYSSVLDSGTTELCRKLDGVIKPKDDPFWERFYPPNHHKCRATVSVLSRKQYDALPASMRRASEQVSGKALDKDAITGKEHQFTSSPLVSMKTLPASMMQRAQEYSLTQSILNYSLSQSQRVLNEQVQLVSKHVLSAATLNKAIKYSPELEPFREMIQEKLLSQPDAIWYGLDHMADGAWLPVLTYQLVLDDQHSALALVAAFDEAIVLNIHFSRQSELDKRLADHINMSDSRQK
ncbi:MULTISPECIES: phage head morphogenesis protein [unclassified Vibrio]|uniref:phage head morphogenesis protein n=1 Tax=unclassified Vibrio TaxID=2614977 RepID=UPI001360E55E|nr:MULTISPECIES: phage minor head protein [unclassified Vibrio]NAW59324.1 phage head morphogenesis protein [Vibrio sp. V36_P2S2PM302]NAX21474.1 phage head morphogenesis protein [Vibrio sp. V39_P1S14PM300]NAX25006.1 phage head morphogenesis protein [Vibrio sp. V38_P2S17PM301]NAX29207.1 phage head morphogenesis protein [Vibrio sp. V37_P2S8PM304]